MTKIQNFFMPLFFLMITNCLDESLFTQFNIIRNKANNYTAQDMQREDLEYPRKESRILKVLQEKWGKYYLCLKQKEQENNKPGIRRLVEGQNTIFYCDICPRPFQDYEELEWKYRPLLPNTNIKELEHLDLTPEMTLTENKTLKIFNVIENLAGLYACYHKKNVIRVYILEVSKNDTVEKAETQQIHGKRFFKLEKDTFKIYHQWTEWTECSACGRIGKKLKYGTCFISLKREPSVDVKLPHELYRRQKSISRESLIKHNRYLRQSPLKNINLRNIFKKDNASFDEDLNQKNWGLEIVKKFSGGIPCTSQYLPRDAYEFVKKYKAVKVLVKYCWEPCQTDEIFMVFDNFGNVIEIANNSAGIYSTLQKLPQLPRDVERRSLVAEFGKNVIIQCPGTSLINSPIFWKFNNKIIFPEVIANESNGRFTIDFFSRIHIKKLRLKDGKIYSCWQKGRLVGTVNLNVEKKLKIRLDHHITLIGLLAIIGLLLITGTKILRRELEIQKKLHVPPVFLLN